MIKSIEKEKKKPLKMIESYISSPVAKSFLTGAFSGTCSTVLLQPFDLIKTRIQSPVALGKKAGGIAAVTRAVWQNEKLSGFWNGVSPSLFRTVPGIALYFSSLHWLQSNFGTADPSSLESACMGATARCISGASVLPFTVVKTRFESGIFAYSGINHALRSIYKHEGARGLYSGLIATLLRDVPFSALYLVFYSKTKKMVKQCEGWENPGPAVNFSCGIVSGIFASAVTHPADVVKTHMQLYPDKFTNVRMAYIHIKEKDGIRGFLRGLEPRILRRSIMAALTWTLYEAVLARFGLK